MNKIPVGSKGTRNQSVMLVAILLAAMLFSLSACENLEDKAKEVANQAAEFAGEVTASWLGTTAGKVGESYNKATIERLQAVAVTVEKITHEEEGEQKNYTITLTLNNSAPDKDKVYVEDLLEDNYLIACDKRDYAYRLLIYNPNNGSTDYDNMLIMVGKSRMTVYTSVPVSEEISYLRYVGEKISLP